MRSPMQLVQAAKKRLRRPLPASPAFKYDRREDANSDFQAKCSCCQRDFRDWGSRHYECTFQQLSNVAYPDCKVCSLSYQAIFVWRGVFPSSTLVEVHASMYLWQVKLPDIDLGVYRVGDSSRWGHHGTRYPSLPYDTSSNRTVHGIQDRIRNCCENHTDCDGGLPTMLPSIN
ncbi:hypothetical protein EJ04DRAFT_228266 [Polyplosphaeria fusca]|uniref:Uncharacterized protein n=1 Tax=Polyplosphaeria fusca TaxID=682080 RepID=A0A9P4QW29_9PLEO|nr:hypothetical protein EJ04DRAFT_228266 [Polyplosphaeria fusca]